MTDYVDFELISMDQIRSEIFMIPFRKLFWNLFCINVFTNWFCSSGTFNELIKTSNSEFAIVH